MLRSLAVFVVLLSACGPADAGRCTSDAQCPVGASCDAKLGVCVTGASNAVTTPLPAEYGKYCENDSHCAGVAGTSCHLNECTFSCAGGTACPGGTTCGGPASPGCFQNCSSSVECKTGAMCGVMKPTSVPEFMGCFPKYPSPTGGTCKDDFGCDNANRCIVSSGNPNGYCTKSCNTKADCSTGDLCVRMSSTDATGMCAPRCDSPGAQSTCVPGTRCLALGGVSYGFCI